jgi:hypothetical protein
LQATAAVSLSSGSVDKRAPSECATRTVVEVRGCLLTLRRNLCTLRACSSFLRQLHTAYCTDCCRRWPCGPENVQGGHRLVQEDIVLQSVSHMSCCPTSCRPRTTHCRFVTRHGASVVASQTSEATTSSQVTASLDQTPSHLPPAGPTAGTAVSLGQRLHQHLPPAASTSPSQQHHHQNAAGPQLSQEQNNGHVEEQGDAAMQENDDVRSPQSSPPAPPPPPLPGSPAAPPAAVAAVNQRQVRQYSGGSWEFVGAVYEMELQRKRDTNVPWPVPESNNFLAEKAVQYGAHRRQVRTGALCPSSIEISVSRRVGDPDG